MSATSFRPFGHCFQSWVSTWRHRGAGSFFAATPLSRVTRLPSVAHLGPDECAEACRFRGRWRFREAPLLEHDPPCGFRADFAPCIPGRVDPAPAPQRLAADRRRRRSLLVDTSAQLAPLDDAVLRDDRWQLLLRGAFGFDESIMLLEGFWACVTLGVTLSTIVRGSFQSRTILAVHSLLRRCDPIIAVC